jgi:gluconate 2-dehydrogenase gamma chain
VPSRLDALVPLLRVLAQPSRREFLMMSALAAAGSACREKTPPAAAGQDAASAVMTSPAGAAAPAGKVLDAAEWRTLEAACARILPSDDGPGAREAGVIGFLDAQLATPALAPAAQALRTLARLLDEVAQRRHGAGFAALAPAQADELLGALAAGTLPVERFPQKEAFAVLHTLTLEGYLSDPRHGGNRGEVGWQAIGFAAPHLRFPGDGGHGQHH